MAEAKKLSSLDASFLYLETPEMPMHVGSMAIFRLPEDYKGDFFEDFKAMIASRLHIAPILKARLEKAPLDIDHPSWVEDDQFDIDRHIFRGSLPAPLRPRHAGAHRRLDACQAAQPRPPALGVLCLRGHEGQRDRALFQDAPRLHRRRRRCGADQHDLRRDAGAAQVEPPPRARWRRSRATSPPTLSIPIRQLWRQPFDASAAPKSIELPRTGKSDIGSILFDNAMFQIESAVKFAGSRADDAQERVRRGRQDLRSEVARQHRQHGVAADPPEQVDLLGAQLCRRIDLAVAGEGARQGLRRQAQRRGAGAVLAVWCGAI